MSLIGVREEQAEFVVALQGRPVAEVVRAARSVAVGGRDRCERLAAEVRGMTTERRQT